MRTFCRVITLLYLDLAYEERKAAGTMRSRADLEEAILHGAVKLLWDAAPKGLDRLS